MESEKSTPRAAEPGVEPYVRIGGVLITLLLLAVTVFVVYSSAIDAIQTWFEWRWVPVARGVFALLVAGLCVWILRRLTGARTGP